MKNFFKSRIFLSIVFTFTCYFMYKIIGFEFTIIAALGSIMSNLYYISDKNK